MGDEDHRLPRILGKEPAVKFTLRRFVERGTDLIQKQDTTWSQQPSGNGNTLGLTLTESTATFTTLGIKTVRQIQHEVSHRRMEHVIKFLVGGIRSGQQQVISDSTAHQGIPLRHKHKVRACLFADALLTLTIIDSHRSLVGFRQRQQQPEQRGLAGTGMSHQRRLTARLKIKREIR